MTKINHKKIHIRTQQYEFLLRKGNGKVSDGLEQLINDYYHFQEKIKTLESDIVKETFGTPPYPPPLTPPQRQPNHQYNNSKWLDALNKDNMYTFKKKYFKEYDK